MINTLEWWTSVVQQYQECGQMTLPSSLLTTLVVGAASPPKGRSRPSVSHTDLLLPKNTITPLWHLHYTYRLMLLMLYTNYPQILCGVRLWSRLLAPLPIPPTATTLTPQPLNNVRCELTVKLSPTKAMMKPGHCEQGAFWLNPPGLILDIAGLRHRAPTCRVSFSLFRGKKLHVLYR